jgi:hypothetical protein
MGIDEKLIRTRRTCQAILAEFQPYLGGGKPQDTAREPARSACCTPGALA